MCASSEKRSVRVWRVWGEERNCFWQKRRKRKNYISKKTFSVVHQLPRRWYVKLHRRENDVRRCRKGDDGDASVIVVGGSQLTTYARAGKTHKHARNSEQSGDTNCLFGKHR